MSQPSQALLLGYPWRLEWICVHAAGFLRTRSTIRTLVNHPVV